MISEQLNDAGITKREIIPALKNDLPWSGDSVKNEVWRNIQVAMGYPRSTAKLKTDEVTKVFKMCNRFFSETFSLPFIDFPSRESQATEALLQSQATEALLQSNF